LCDDEPAHRFNEALSKSGAARRGQAGGWDRSWQSCRDLGAVCPKPPGVATQRRGSPKPTHHREVSHPLSSSAQTTGILFDTSSKKPNPIIEISPRTRHIALPRCARRGVHRRSWKGGESGLRSQAPSKVTGQFPRALSVLFATTLPTREIHRFAPPRSETRISPKGGKQIPVTSIAP